MITPVYEGNPPLGQVRPPMDHERVMWQISEGRVRTGPEAAREIAQRIEGQHGFWDLRTRRAAA